MRPTVPKYVWLVSGAILCVRRVPSAHVSQEIEDSEYSWEHGWEVELGVAVQAVAPLVNVQDLQ